MADFSLDYNILETFGSLATAIASIILIFLLWKTIKQMEYTVQLSKLQTEHRFRPWIGPESGIKYLNTTKDGDHQFDVIIKNFGEIPASNVTAFYKIKNEMIDKSEITKTNVDHKFNLGPLLPNMEKHYWFFINSDLIKKAINQETQIFIGLFFGYEAIGKHSGYGMISQYDSKTNTFVHKDMWVDGSDS
ncbi:MAG: hypothetical protein ACT4OW_02575 [Nitrososphaerota archaeon]